MAFVIRVMNEEGEPLENVPLVLLFNSIDRREAITDDKGEVRFDHCPGVNVLITADGIRKGVHQCYDGKEILIEM
jgi:hypothetical protein